MLSKLNHRQKIRLRVRYMAALFTFASCALILMGTNALASTEASLPTKPLANSTLTEKHDKLAQMAEAGDAVSQYELGLLHEYGRGQQQNDSIAVYWYLQAAKQNHRDAQYRLAVLSDNGWGQPVNRHDALRFYRSAAENGHELAQHDLAIMYFTGSGTPKNLLEAYKWLKIATVSGNPLMEKHLRLVAAEMSDIEINLAEELVQRWLRQSRI